MIGAGIGSFIGGANSKFNGGSYWAGWIGGAISGGLSGLGASLGIFGLGWSFGLATLGNAVGTAITDNLNGVNQDSADYWARLFVDSSLSGLFSIISLKFGNAIGVFNIPGFRNIYAGITVLAEFGFSFMTDRTVSLLEKIADFLKPIFGF